MSACGFARRFARSRARRFSLEFLETRQLLSVSGANLSQFVAHPDLTAAPLVYSASPSGLSPSQVRQAYGINQVTFQNGSVAGNGAGQTIAIVTAYDDPNISADLKTFDREFGIADAPSFIKYVQSGLTQTNSGWSLETSLDVEWAHSIAPGANLVLVEAKSASINDLFGAVNFARSLSGVVAVSMSWGSSEFYGQWNYDPILTTPAGHVGGSGSAGRHHVRRRLGRLRRLVWTVVPVEFGERAFRRRDHARSRRQCKLRRRARLDRQHRRLQRDRAGSRLSAGHTGGQRSLLWAPYNARRLDRGRSGHGGFGV